MKTFLHKLNIIFETTSNYIPQIGDVVKITHDFHNEKYPQDNEGEIVKKWGGGSWEIKTNNGKTLVLPPSNFHFIGRKKFNQISSNDNIQLVDNVIKVNPQLFEYKPKEGTEFIRVIYENPGKSLIPNSLGSIGLRSSPNAYGIHVTDDPYFWIDTLEHDYERDSKKAKIIRIYSVEGDAVFQDSQQAMPSERLGRTGDSHILVTGRPRLIYGKDWSK